MPPTTKSQDSTYHRSKGIKRLFSEIGITLSTCEPLDTYRGGKTANYYCGWDGFHATIWVDVNGYLLNDPAKLKDAIRKVMASGGEAYNY